MPTALDVAKGAVLRRDNKQQQLAQDQEQARHDIKIALRRNYTTAEGTLEQMIHDNSLHISAEASAAIEKLIKKARFIYNKGTPVYGGEARIREVTSILNWVINVVHGEHSELAIYQLVDKEISNRSGLDRKISVPVFFAVLFFEYLLIDYIRQIRFSQWKDLYDPICVMICLFDLSILKVIIEGNAYTLGDELEIIGKHFNMPEEMLDDQLDAQGSLAYR